MPPKIEDKLNKSKLAAASSDITVQLLVPNTKATVRVMTFDQDGGRKMLEYVLCIIVLRRTRRYIVLGCLELKLALFEKRTF